jgi:hypothetical protein
MDLRLHGKEESHHRDTEVTKRRTSQTRIEIIANGILRRSFFGGTSP